MNRLIFLCFLMILLISETTCTCNPEWQSWNSSCFKVFNYILDIRLARRFCQVFRGDIAFSPNNATLAFFNTLQNFDNGTTYWANETSQLSSPSSEKDLSQDCPYIKQYEVLFGSCEDHHSLICEVADESYDFYCPGNAWQLYGSDCFQPVIIINKTVSYREAGDYCERNNNSYLAVLDDISKEHHAAAAIFGRYLSFVVGALSYSGILKWSNGKEFVPSCQECVHEKGVQDRLNAQPGDCLGFQSNPDHPLIFLWYRQNCSSTKAFLCEMPAMRSDFQMSTSTIVDTTTTSGPELLCPIGANWKSHEDSGYCFWETTYESDRLNWFQARKFCQAYGGDLATYQNAEQEHVGLGGAKGHYRGLWFGLERDEYNVFRWVDESALTYTNWDSDEPDLKSSSKFCAVHGSGSALWQLDYCGLRRWFICKAPKMARPSLPDTNIFKLTSCNVSSLSVYRNDWRLFGDHCYLLHDVPKYSWDMAKDFCQDNGGHLVSIHSFEETNFLLLLNSYPSDTVFWTGLSARGLDSTYEWSDGSPLDFFYLKDDTDFENVHAIESCVTFNGLRGYWKSDHCNRFLGVICKRGLNSSLEPETPEPTELVIGNCEKGWYPFGNKCFSVFAQKWSQQVNWKSAKEKCEEMGATLASIHSDEEQNYVHDLLLVLSTMRSAWIGLHDVHRGTLFQWSDNSPIDYVNWHSGHTHLKDDEEEDGLDSENLFKPEKCVQMVIRGFKTGKWDIIPCSSNGAYVCQKPKSANITEAAEDPFACNITGWFKLAGSCYGILENESLSWVDAQAACRTYGANLATIRSDAESGYLQRRVTRKDQVFWIGVRIATPTRFVNLVGKMSLSFSNWLPGQPKRRGDHMSDCVAINSDGKWMIRDCNELHGYFCELGSSEITKANPEVVLNSCPSSNWLDMGGNSCYQINSYRKTWDEAMFDCFHQSGHLASFHSIDEVNLVRQHLISKDSEQSFYIGLAKRRDGSLAWVDHSAVDLAHFAFNLNTLDANFTCGEMSIRTGRWSLIDCKRERPYVCAIKKEVLEGGTLGLLPDTLKGDISGSSVFGIVFGVLVVLLVVCAVVYAYPLLKAKMRFSGIPPSEDEGCDL